MDKVNTLKYANDEYVKILLNSFLEKIGVYRSFFERVTLVKIEILNFNLCEIMTYILTLQFKYYRIQEIIESKNKLEHDDAAEIFLKLTTIYLRELNIIDAKKEVNINEMNFELKVPIIMSLVKDNILFSVDKDTPF